jgi:cytochrome c peroxidase
MASRRLPWILAASTAGLFATLAQAATTPPPPSPPGPPPAGPPGGPPPNTPPTNPTPPNTGQVFADPTGQMTTISTTGQVTATHPFFASLGRNGRACVTCHQPGNAWSITPANAQARFQDTNGLDPLFRTVDGSNSPNADVSTPATRRAAYSMLLSKGDIRVGLPVPTNAQFTLAAANDPYRFASSAELSLFRRPLPTTNLKTLSVVMWDGRETVTGAAMSANLAHQAANAVLTHAQGASAPSAAALQQIVAFETGLFSAQSFDRAAGALNINGADGGPLFLSSLPFTPGENDPLSPTFNPKVFTIFDKWTGIAGTDPQANARRSIARGESIFNTRPIAVTNVAGINDVVHLALVRTTCSGCHNTPNAGNHSSADFLDLGLSDAGRRTPDMPLYTLRNKTTGGLRLTTDPGRALVTGKWEDIGKFKVPTLRGLPARAPYFHNGSAASTGDVIAFYNGRFNMNLSPQERNDLKAFLDSL